ncbi:hypothetical protein NL676_004837 [Syzygium grande]|nr:hypothetical protein NL676_004837 [Syzygium grande]
MRPIPVPFPHSRLAPSPSDDTRPASSPSRPHIPGSCISGFNSTLCEGNATHNEYIQVGKGRDVGLNQFDFFRMLSFFFTTVSFCITYSDWNKWICKLGGINVYPKRSWEAWWEEEQEHLHHSRKCGIIPELILAVQFFIYQYSLVYGLAYHGL